VSYSDFQAAIALAIHKPDFVRSLRQGDCPGLEHLELSDKEWRRLRGLAVQPGMAFYCSLARANRLEAIADAYPMTLVVLEPCLGEFLDRLWTINPPSGYRFDREIEQFEKAVEAGLADGSLVGGFPYLREVFRYEQACWSLAASLRESPIADAPDTRVVEFEHPPDLLLPPLSRLEAPPPDLPSRSYRVEVSLRGGRFSFAELPG
jgi:hypothetical protein